MTRSFVHSRGRGAAVAALLLALAIPLAACGSSSSGSSGGGSTSAASTTASATGPAGGRAGFARLRSCLQQQGVTLPRPPAGAQGRTQTQPNGGGGPGFGFRRGGGFFSRLPIAERMRLQAAMQKCGARFGARFRRFGFDASSPAFRRALTAYVACVRRNGFDLPAPNTSGNGPIFDPSKVNRQDPRYLAANAKCQQLLAAARPAPPGGAPPTPGAGG